MKQYYFVKLYQASPNKGYFKNGEQYKELVLCEDQDDEYKVEMEFSITDTETVIMVEKIWPNLVREVKTGIIFPILNFKAHPKRPGDEYVTCTYGKIHTFVCSRNNKLISVSAKTSEYLEKYNKMYPDAAKLKEELESIIAFGEKKVKSRVAYERKRIEQINAKKKAEETAKRDEKAKTRKLERQFKQGRKRI